MKRIVLIILALILVLPLALLYIQRPKVKADSTVISDTFTRTTSGGWGSAETGGSYTLTGSATDFAVNGIEGTMTAPTASVTRWAVLSDNTYLDQDITVKLKTDKVAGGTSQEYFVVGRYINSTLMYRAKIRLTPSNAVTVQGSKVVSGTETLLGTQVTVSGLTYSANNYIKVRFKLSGTNPTTLQIKAWADGSSEPVSWNYTTTDSEATLQVAGGAGLRLNMPASTSNAPIVATFDDFAMVTSDVVIPPAADPQTGLTLLSDTFGRSVSGGWGTPDSGGSYLITSGTASDFNVTGATGTINSPTASVTRSLILNNSSQQNIDIKFKVKLDKVPIGNAMEIFWQGRRVDPSNHYRGKIRLTSSNTVTLQATKVVGGTETLLGTQASTGITYNAGDYVYIRSQVTGTNPTTINMKAWLDSTTEPVSWNYTITDSESVLQHAGALGFRTSLPSTLSNAPILTTFDDINVTTQDAQINSPTAEGQEGTNIVTDTFTRTTSNGWGTADVGGAYSIVSGTTSSFSTDGSIGSISSIAGTSRNLALVDTKQQDVDIKFRVKVDKIPTGNATEAFVVARRINPSYQYRGKIRFSTAAGITLQSSSVINGTETLLGTQASTSIAYVANNFIWVRMKVIGTSPTAIYMKAWANSDSEPINWQYSTTDYQETALQEAGSIGFRVNTPSSVTNDPITTSFDDISVYTTDTQIYDPQTATVPPAPTPGPDAITVTINLSNKLVTSKLNVGATHTQESSNPAGDSTAIQNAKSLLQNGLHYQNQHIIGFGADNLWDDPSKGVSSWNWSALDRRVQLMRDTGSVPILTLCGAPTWMIDPTWSPGKYNGSNTDWGQLEKAPLDIYEADFAYMVQKIIERYDGVNLDSNGVAFPKIEYFQVWNEMKGFWDRSVNHWNYDKYNRMYGLVYDTIKATRPEANVGGPYVRLNKYLYPSGIKTSAVTDSSYGTVDQRDLNVITQWLTWLDSNRDGSGNLKAQFLTLDAGINTKDIIDGTFPNNVWDSTKIFSDMDAWLNTQMTSIISTQLPIWWAEDYVGKVNGDPLLITPENKQSSALAMLLYRHVMGGSSTSLRWGPEEQLSTTGVAQGNRQNLFSSTEFANGGQAYPNYYVYKYFNDYFSNGTDIYDTSFSPSSSELTVLTSSAKTLLINERSTPITVTLSESGDEATYTVAAYEVKLVDVPAAPVGCTDTAPGTPDIYAADNQSTSRVKLYFTQATGTLDHYELHYGTKSGTYTKFDTNIGNQSIRSYLVKGLTASTTYYFQIRAVNGCQNGAWSNEYSTTTLANANSSNSSTITVDDVQVTDDNTNSNDNNNDNTEGKYKVVIDLIDQNVNPVIGANIELDSETQNCLTDGEGECMFENIRAGDHTLIITYKGKVSTHQFSISETDDSTFLLKITIKTQAKPTNSNNLLIPIIIGIVSIIVIISSFVFIKKKLQD